MKTLNVLLRASAATVMAGSAVVTAGSVTAGAKEATTPKDPGPVTNYRGAGSEWTWHGEANMAGHPNPNLRGNRVWFDDTVRLDSWVWIAGCSNVWFTGSSHVRAPVATSVKLADRFWFNTFGPGSITAGWPPGLNFNDQLLPDAWTDSFNGTKGDRNYWQLNFNLPNLTTFTGVNHEIAGEATYGAFGNVIIGRANMGEAVC